MGDGRGYRNIYTVKYPGGPLGRWGLRNFTQGLIRVLYPYGAVQALIAHSLMRLRVPE
jgi:hypothetical protein